MTLGRGREADVRSVVGQTKTRRAFTENIRNYFDEGRTTVHGNPVVFCENTTNASLVQVLR